MEKIELRKSMLDEYKERVKRGGFDEMCYPNGDVREHWQPIVESLENIGEIELSRRHQEIQRLLRENGVTYNVYGDPQGLNRPWQLDPIPFVISNTEWKVLEVGLMQRAELFNMMLADIYGERRLVRQGLLPMELLYNHPGFIRQCDQIRAQGWHQLLIYAADVARAPDGKMWVISDRTQAPSGTGYTLENRSTMTRVLPDLFQGVSVKRISNYFSTSQNSLSAFSPNQKENPRVVLLTPGAMNETYFEHAYLASYLGYTLVQGDDLTVRDGCVWLKSLSGLQQVDIILRRVDDSYCDPLELREDSRLGIAGLLECVRRKTVGVANPIGSSVLENPGILAFLPSIAKYMLGEELIIPSAATWWCGQPKELDFVLRNIQKLVIKNIFPQSGAHAIFGNKLTNAEIDRLRGQIKAQPHLYVGQEMVSFSTSPSYINGKVEPRYAVMRNFLFGQKEGYAVMPGGLTRSAPEPGNFVVSNQSGGTSKDTWILQPEPEPSSVIIRTDNKLLLPKSIAAMPSRTAENLYWVGRYAERALGTSRVLRTVLRCMSEANELEQEDSTKMLQTMLRSITHFTMTYPGFVGENSEELLKNPEPELLSVILDNQRSGSLSSTLTSFFRATYAVRDLLSLDCWRVIDHIDRNWQEIKHAKKVTPRQIQTILDQMVLSLVAFNGLNNESMSSEHGWVLLDLGRRIENVQLQIAMLRATLVAKQDEAVEYSIMEAVLSTEESLTTYRYQYRSYLQFSTVLDLLLLDESHPRSMAYQMNRIQECIAKLPRKLVSHRLSEEERIVLEAATLLKLSDTVALAECQEGEMIRVELDNKLAKISHLLAQTSNVIVRSYFSHSQPQQQLMNATLQPIL